MKRIEDVIEQVNGTMAMEGMPLTDEDKERIRRCAESPKLVENEIRLLVQKHSAPMRNTHEQRL